MGLLGAAFGLGFIFGPAIGGVLGGNDAAIVLDDVQDLAGLAALAQHLVGEPQVS